MLNWVRRLRHPVASNHIGMTQTGYLNWLPWEEYGVLR
jgi:hypothetical protein